jgi:hypothetical protein
VLLHLVTRALALMQSYRGRPDLLASSAVTLPLLELLVAFAENHLPRCLASHPQALTAFIVELSVLACATTSAEILLRLLAAWGAVLGMGMGGGYASTAQQAADYGMSQVVRSQGYANLKNSEAAKNWEEAKTQEIQNRMRWTETYFEMRKTNREARAAEDGPPVTQEQAIRMAKMTLPSRLGSTQLDPVTGHIEYPMVLQDDIFAPYRQELDTIFARRASTGGSLQYEEFK